MSTNTQLTETGTGQYVITFEREMKIVLHFGPHKTGTTAIQSALGASREQILKEHGIWYPEVASQGPGHAEWASKIAVADGRALNEITEEVVRAPSSIDCLLLSSENFIRLPESRIRELSLAFRQTGASEITAAFTLTPYRRRFFSFWGEMVKHGWSLRFEDSLTALVSDPGIAPDSPLKAARALQSDRVAILMHQSTSPQANLAGQLLSVSGLGDIAVPTQLRLNQAAPLFVSELLCWMNDYLNKHVEAGHDRRALRGSLLAALNDSQRWQELLREISITPPEVKGTFVRRIDQLVGEHILCVERLETEMDCTIRGDKAWLDDTWPVEGFTAPFN